MRWVKVKSKRKLFPFAVENEEVFSLEEFARIHSFCVSVATNDFEELSKLLMLLVLGGKL